MSKLSAIAIAVVVALAALASTSAQQEPPYRFYGPTGTATAGDMISVRDGMNYEIGSATVDDDGSWFIDVDRDNTEGVTFTVNGAAAEANITSTGSGQSIVTLEVMVVEEEEEEEEESMMEEDGGGSMSEGDDEAMMEEEPDEIGFPNSGSGGLDHNSGMSAGLIGLLIAVGTAAIAGLGLRRARTRA